MNDSSPYKIARFLHGLPLKLHRLGRRTGKFFVFNYKHLAAFGANLLLSGPGGWIYG
jgi:hypothetical protein